MPLNQKRAQRYLQDYEIRAFVATTPVSVAYITDLDCWAYRTYQYYMAIPGGSEARMQSYAVLTPEARMLIAETLVSTFHVEKGVELRPYGDEPKSPTRVNNRGGFIEDVAAYKEGLAAQRPTAAEALVGALRDKGITSGRVGIEKSNISTEAFSRVKKALPRVRFLDSPHLIRLIRMVKNAEEVGRLKKAQEIAEKAMMKALSSARIGRRVWEISHAYRVEIAKQDALIEKWHCWANGHGVSENEDARVLPGWVSGFDAGCIYKMYYCDTGISVVAGKNAEAERTYKALVEVVDQSLDYLHAGATPAEILGALKRAGGSRNVDRANSQGHGIGLETREHPVIKASPHKTIRDQLVDIGTEIPLEDGMVINIETPLYIPGKADYQVERAFLVRKKAPLELTPKRGSAPFLIQAV